MKHIALICCLIFFPAIVQADDDPDATVKTEDYNKEEIIQKMADDCTNTLCQNSSDLDCTDKCLDDARTKYEAENH